MTFDTIKYDHSVNLPIARALFQLNHEATRMTYRASNTNRYHTRQPWYRYQRIQCNRTKSKPERYEMNFNGTVHRIHIQRGTRCAE